jgi:copper chaperone CopZ
MTFSVRNLFRAIALAGLLVIVAPVHAEYLRIQLRVYGLDCALCARGVTASIQRLDGVKTVDVSLKKGMLDITLAPGNTFKMSDLRKRIRENGFRSVDATVTAVGQFNGSKFEVLGSGELYDVNSPNSKSSTPIELTFEVHNSK